MAVDLSKNRSHSFPEDYDGVPQILLPFRYGTSYNSPRMAGGGYSIAL
jgi:hypothetical protein